MRIIKKLRLQFFGGDTIKHREKLNILSAIGVLIYRQFLQDGCLYKAAGLAYATLLSLVPLFAMSFSVISAFPVFQPLQKKIQNLIVSNFIITPGVNVEQYLQDFIGQVENLSVFGVLILFVTAVLLVFGMEQTFNGIWRVARNRHGVTAFLLYWAVITLIPLVIAVMLFLYLALISVPWISAHPVLSVVGNFFSFLMPYFAVFLSFVLLYVALPNCRVPLGSAAIGALVATGLFEIARNIFAIYIIQLTTYKLIYGALAIIPIFLIWLYISWVVILFGVVVNHVLANYEYKKSWLKWLKM